MFTKVRTAREVTVASMKNESVHSVPNGRTAIAALRISLGRNDRTITIIISFFGLLYRSLFVFLSFAMPIPVNALTSTSTSSQFPSPSNGPLFINSVLGTGFSGNGGSGLPATSTSINNPTALALEDTGTLLVAGKIFGLAGCHLYSCKIYLHTMPSACPNPQIVTTASVV